MKTTMTKLATFAVVLTGVVAMSSYLGTSQAVPIPFPPVECGSCPQTFEDSRRVCTLVQCSNPCKYICQTKDNAPTGE